MTQITAYHYDAFSAIPYKGNPAAVVLAAAGLSPSLMQRVAERIGFNETAFVLPSERADLRLRYFTPGHEMDLCGHATIASIFALVENGWLPHDHLPMQIETNAAILPIRMERSPEGPMVVYMRQIPAQFIPFEGDVALLTDALGISPDDLLPDLPVVYGSTGIWTLIVPVKGLDVMRRMRAFPGEFPGVMAQIPRASIHPICLETTDPGATLHGRHFSSPYSGTVEDPVTGTASGVAGAYFAHYVKQDRQADYDLIVEQGHEMDRDGRVLVHVRHRADEYQVEIAGTAVYVKRIELEIT